MTYTRLLIGDSNVGRFWASAQTARPQLVGVPFKSATCLDTFSSALSDVTDALDFVMVSVLTGLLIDEGSASYLMMMLH